MPLAVARAVLELRNGPASLYLETTGSKYAPTATRYPESSISAPKPRVTNPISQLPDAVCTSRPRPGSPLTLTEYALSPAHCFIEASSNHEPRKHSTTPSAHRSTFRVAKNAASRRAQRKHATRRQHETDWLSSNACARERLHSGSDFSVGEEGRTKAGGGDCSTPEWVRPCSKTLISADPPNFVAIRTEGKGLRARSKNSPDPA